MQLLQTVRLSQISPQRSVRKKRGDIKNEWEDPMAQPVMQMIRPYVKFEHGVCPFNIQL